MICTFKHHFSAAHFYNQRQWSKEKNQKIFGRCFSEYGHGHDYLLEVTLDLDQNFIDVSDQIVAKVTGDLDHKHLNFDIPEFKNKIPTTENILSFLEQQISNALSEQGIVAHLRTLRLFESPQVWTEFNKP